MRPLCSAMLRIKNEARWIDKVIRSIYPLCHRIFVLNDHSEDETANICRAFPNVSCYDSPFDGLDESRDKNWLYDKVLDAYPNHGYGVTWPHWLLCIDGDEVLRPESLPILFQTLLSDSIDAVKFKITYLWDTESQVRCDGVYGDFWRPSLFRVINPAFRFQSTPWGNGANFHCSSIPQELLGCSVKMPVELLHYGYLHREDRLRKYSWYNSIDPNNFAEDCYRHIVQGDVSEVPADASLLHAGPLVLRNL